MHPPQLLDERRFATTYNDHYHRTPKTNNGPLIQPIYFIIIIHFLGMWVSKKVGPERRWAGRAARYRSGRRFSFGIKDSFLALANNICASMIIFSGKPPAKLLFAPPAAVYKKQKALLCKQGTVHTGLAVQRSSCLPAAKSLVWENVPTVAENKASSDMQNSCSVPHNRALGPKWRLQAAK